MKIVIQRVSQAQVCVKDQIVGAIGVGVVVFVGITNGDTVEQSAWLAQKLVHLRLFEDAAGKMNQSLLDRNGSALIISQFTLYGDCSAGRRPSFTLAAPPEIAEPLYGHFVDAVRKGGVPVETGIFGAKMQVSLVNDGPVTLLAERSPT